MVEEAGAKALRQEPQQVFRRLEEPLGELGTERVSGAENGELGPTG